MQDRLIAFWPVNKGDGGVLKDITGNGYDVTLNSSYSGSNWSSLASPISSYRDGYRYGFNGKENDNEVKGEGNQQDYGMRIYDPRLGRFLSVDPITQDYPWLTPYQFASDNPITLIDQDGLEGVFKMPNGQLYFHPPSDNLKIPIPVGAVPQGKMAVHSDDGEAISLALDLIPFVGQVKGIYEAVTGVDPITGRKLSAKERALGVIPYAGKAKKVSKVLNATQKVTKTEQKVVKAAAVVEKMKEKGKATLRKKETKPEAEQENPILPEKADFTKIEAPDGWITKPSKKGGGTRYVDPNNSRNVIRQMPGDPNSPHPSQQVPYVKYQKDGVFYDINGQKVKDGNASEAHIPLSSFDQSKMPKF